MGYKPRILVFQHIAVEHPGIFRSFLQEDGIDWFPVELDQNEPIPPLNGYDALWVMGGPMDVWQEQQHPWLIAEKAAIREAVSQRQLPFLGLCLGHQLLADALGGHVGPSEQPEIGIMDVNLTEAGMDSPFFDGISRTTKCLQWHSAEVTTVPEAATVLASTPTCQVQAMSTNDNALSIQFHVEISSDTVSEWGVVPEYKQALEKNFGANALSQFELEAAANMDDFNNSARILYANWKSKAFG